MDSAEPARPTRRDVAAAYDRGVDGYANVWSPVILPAAQAVVSAMGLAPAVRVMDIGGGSGALVPSIKRAAPNSEVIAVDASQAMLGAARARTNARVVQADALALPIRNDIADAVLLAFVLFHLSNPHTALAESARVLRAGGSVGLTTWAHETSPAAYAVWNRTLTEAGAVGLPARRVDAGLDSPEAVTDSLKAVGLEPTDVWVEPLSHQWTADTYLQLALGSGLNQIRLDALDPPTQTRTVDLARERLDALQPTDFAWSGEVVCAVASVAKPVPGA